MFDCITIGRRSVEHVPFEKSVVVTEVRAPTDDSLRLLQEMREKTCKDIVATLHVKDNVVNVAACLSHDPLSYTDVATYRIVMNGAIFSDCIRVPRGAAVYLEQRRTLLHTVAAEVARLLTERVLQRLLDGDPK